MKTSPKCSSDEGQSNHKRDVLFFTLYVSFFGWFVCVFRLINGPYPTGKGLYYTYFTYFVFTVIVLHLGFFALNTQKKLKTGKTLSKNLPKYLEYIYAALLTIGLTQIFFLSTQFAAYITLVSGDEPTIIKEIMQQSRSHLAVDCPKGGEFFTDEYCEKLQQIVDAPSPDTYITDIMLTDYPFLNHAIRKDFHATQGGMVEIYVFSPIKKYADSLRAIKEYGGACHPATTNDAFKWVAFMLLPIGIGVRILKTSVELFGDLDTGSVRCVSKKG